MAIKVWHSIDSDSRTKEISDHVRGFIIGVKIGIRRFIIDARACIRKFEWMLDVCC